MTVRNRHHSKAMTRVARFLDVWNSAQPKPRGDILTGEAGVLLARNPDTTVGVDVVYVSAEVVAQQSDDTTLIDGVPTLVVEILSPNDTVEQIREKLNRYLKAGVPLIWIIDPYQQTVTIHRQNQKPVLVNADQEIKDEPNLPGFQVRVAEFFE